MLNPMDILKASKGFYVVDPYAMLWGKQISRKNHVERYGLKIAKKVADPYARVSYMYDAEGFTPAKMNYTTGQFEYGSWADAFFVKKNYPVMCKYDGTEDYELNHDDHTKKLDGTPSDIADITYQGNAMSCFDCKIWIKAWEDDDYEYYAISNIQYDEDYHDYPYIRADGTHADKLYYPMFKGATDGTRLRSMSGLYPQNKTSSTAEINLCNANGSRWRIGDWAHREWLNVLLLMMSKDDNSQRAYGQGCTEGGADDASINYGFVQSGALNTKGQFFGYSTTKSAVKVFYIENWWGNRWDRCLGLWNDKGDIKVKWTPPYSNTSTDGCTSTGLIAPASGYQKQTSNTWSRLPVSVGGSASTYTCDYFYSNNNQLNLAVVGGRAGHGAYCGSWYVGLNAAASSSNWYVGASPYLEQPS